MSFSRGDVVLVAFPNADLITYKKRPAIIVQSDHLPPHYGDKLVACITSNMQKSGSTRVQVARHSVEGQQMGLLMDSVIVVDNITTLPVTAITKKIGDCPVNIRQQVDRALRETFDV